MSKRCIQSPAAAPAVGPYSHAVAAGKLLFVSGQCPFAHDGSGPIEGGIEDQARLALENLRRILEDAGSGVAHVLKTTVFLVDMAEFAAFNAVYAEVFQQDCPARSCIEVRRLPKDVRVEIEAIALIPSS